MARLRFVAILTIICCFLFPPLSGQTKPGDDGGTLYFPPKLMVNYQFGNGEPVLGITETVNRSSTLLIPVIFFDHPGDWGISPRYRIFNGSFAARDYADTNPVRQWDPMGKYYEILNIVGFRMREHPGTAISIRGGYSTEPGENAEVGGARADVVREYLTAIWGIAPGRIEILPPQQMCDSTEHPFRQQEARHVMIVAGDWEILEPVHYPIEIRNIGSLYLRFTIDPYTAPEDVAEIEIVMAADDKIIGQAVIPGSPDSTLYQVRGMWWRNGGQIAEAEYFSSISVEAFVRLRDGRVHRSNTKKISVQINRYDMVEPDVAPISLTLPFFPYGDSILTGYHRMLIDRFMATQPSERQIAMDLMGTADFSEDPEVDPARIADYLSIMSSEEDNGFETFPPEDGQLVLWSTPRESDVYEYDSDYIDSDYIDSEEEGDKGEEGEYADSAEMEIEEHRFTSDSLAMARTRTVERYLRDSLKINFVTFDQLPGRARGVATTIEILPEERWLARSVVLVVHPYSRFTEQRNWVVKQMEESENGEESLRRE